MKVTPTALAGVKLIEPQVFGDDRGFFMESWNARTFAAAGLDATFVQATIRDREGVRADCITRSSMRRKARAL
jgi:dTDP-4-dehydrorhamnose 3,5-epimerase